MLIKPDKTFYPSAKLAMQAPPEKYCYVGLLNPPANDKPDALLTIDLDPKSDSYSSIIGRTDMLYKGDELHHYGWNACSSALCPNAPHPHIERRYLIIPGIRSSRMYVLDTKKNPTQPKIVKTLEPEELIRKTGYSAYHTVHCGPAGIYVSALGNEVGDGPGGIFLLDHQTFDVLGKWEVDRGDQYLQYDFWWNLGYDVLISSEWGTPNMIQDGVNPEILLDGGYGHQIHMWDLPRRRHLKTLDLGREHQMALEVRPAHDPTKTYGFVCSVLSLNDLSGSIWLWYLENDEWEIQKIIEIPAQPADAKDLPPILKSFNAVPPLISDIVLSLDDKYLYISCWGTGELHQYDVSTPHEPKLVSTVKIGGIVNRTPHPSQPQQALNGGAQMVEASLDGKRLYFTNSLYSTWDDQFYPDGLKGWMVKVNIQDDGTMQFDNDFFVDFGKERPHQIRLEGGDCSTDSYCYS